LTLIKKMFIHPETPPTNKAIHQVHQDSLQGSDCIQVLKSAIDLINFNNLSKNKASELEKEINKKCRKHKLSPEIPSNKKCLS
jgi:hypothetical protein